MLKFVFVLSIMLSVAACTHAPEPPKVVVDSAMQLYFDYDYDDPDNDGAPRPAPDQARRFVSKKVLRPVNFSGSALPDWVIDVEADPTVAWCGTGGCKLQIWRPEADGAYQKVFDQQVRQWKLKPDKGLWVDLHGTACGSYGADACPFAFAWSPEGYVRASTAFASGPVIRGGPLPQALDDPNGAPEALKGLAEAAQAGCEAAGADMAGEFAVVNRAPDLNGDGVGDWSFDNANSYCVFADDPDYGRTRAFDSCAVMDCVNLLFISEIRSDGVAWKRIDLGRDGYAFRVDKAGFTAVRLEALPGHGYDDDEAPCSAYDLNRCVVTDIEMPK